MTGNLEVSDQDVRDLVKTISWLFADEGETQIWTEQERQRLEVLKERLLKVNVNEF